MLSEGGRFSKELNHLVDHRLKTLFSGGEPVARDSSCRSRSRQEEEKPTSSFPQVWKQVYTIGLNRLPGQFSGHLGNALSTYLSVMEEKKEA